jgi:tape measure domain-containing protein
MATNVGSLEATLALNAKGFTSGVDDAKSALGRFGDSIKSIGSVAAGVLTAGAITGMVHSIQQVGAAAINAVASMQQMEKAIQSLAASELVRGSKGTLSFTDALGKAGKTANETMEYIRDLSIVSPFSYESVVSAFQLNASMGQTIDTAKMTTEAILNLGSGLALSQDEMNRLSVALAQVGSTGKITAMDVRQFANSRFGLDKLNDVFAKMSVNTGVTIKTYEDFNKAMERGKVTTDDFYKALSEYSKENFGGSVELMSGTISGLKSTLGDIKYFAMADIFKPLGDSAAKALKPIVGYIGDFLGEGGFKDIGKKIEKWFQPAIDSINKLGKSMTNGTFKMALKNLQGWLKGSAEEGQKFAVAMDYIFGKEMGGKITEIVGKLNGFYQFFAKYKDYIIDALKTIAEAFALLIIIKTVTDLVTALTSPIGLLIEAIGLLGIAWKNNFLGIQDIVKDFVADVKPKLSGFVDDIEGWINSAKKYITEIKNVYDEQGFSGVIAKIKEDAAGIIPPEVMQSIVNLCSSIMKYFETVKTGLERIVQQIKNLFKAPVKSLDQMAEEVGPFEYGKEPTDGIDMGWTTIISSQISSMSKVFEVAERAIGYFLDAMLNLLVWANQNKESIISAMQSIASAIGSIGVTIVEKGLVAGLMQLQQYLGKLIPPGLVEAITGIAIALGLVFAPLQTILAALAAIADIAIHWGSNPLGLNKEDYDDIGESFSNIKTYISEIWTNLKSIFGINTSNDPLKQIGEDADNHKNSIETLGNVLTALADALEWVVEQIKNATEFFANLKLPEVDTQEYDNQWGNGNIENSTVVSMPKSAVDETIKTLNRLNGYSIPVPDGNQFSQFFVHPSGTLADPVNDLVLYVQQELDLMGADNYVSGPEELKRQIVSIFEALSDTIVGNSIVPDMVRDVNAEFEGWWDAVEPFIDAVTDGIKKKFEELAQALRDIVSSITGTTTGVGAGLEGMQAEGPMPAQAGQTNNFQQTSAGGILGQLFVPVPDDVMTSYQNFIDKLVALKEAIISINLVLSSGAAGGTGGAAAGAGNGLLDILKSINDFIAKDFTATLTELALMISVQGTFGSSLNSMNLMLYSEGATTATYQILSLINDFMAANLTITMTEFAFFISLEGSFGSALDTLNKTLYTEGSNAALYQILVTIHDYMKKELSEVFEKINDYIRNSLMPTFVDLNYLLFYGENTTYNALGAIFGVTKDINTYMKEQKRIIREELVPAYKYLQENSGLAEGALQAIADAASGVASQMNSATLATWGLIAALEALNSYQVPGMNPRTTGGSSRTKEALAGGGYVSARSTYLVGEAGPELFTPSRSGWIIPNDQLADGTGEQTVYNIEIHDVYGDKYLEQRIKKGVTEGIRNAEFVGLRA